MEGIKVFVKLSDKQKQAQKQAHLFVGISWGIISMYVCLKTSIARQWCSEAL
jgi:hypothetical protein